MAAIECTKLTKYYGKTKGIAELDLKVEQGELFGFIGPNGSGKSTTIRCLLGLIKASSGSAKVLGLDIESDKLKILERVGYMPSEANFYPRMRVHDVIKLATELHGIKHNNGESKRLCERFELDTKKRVEELSLGNRKKLSIVCAFLHKPDLYILDEPSSGLDPLMQQEFFSLLHERQAEGATIFLSSHVLSEVQRHCGRAAIIREGHIIALDTVEDLAKSALKKIHIHGLTQLPQIDGIIDPITLDDSVTFLFQGSAQTLIHALQNLPITDISIQEPDLEAVFLHRYTNGEVTKHDGL